MKTLENGANGANLVSVNEVVNTSSVELVNVDLLAGLSDDSPAVVGLDVEVKTFRADVLRRYEVVPFGSFADWCTTDEGLAYRSEGEKSITKGSGKSLTKDQAKKVASWLSDIVYPKLKKEWDTKEEKRVVKFSPVDMVSFIHSRYEKEFTAIVGCPIGDVEGIDLSGKGAKVSNITSWSLTPRKFGEGFDLTGEGVDLSTVTASAFLSALLTFKHRFPRLTAEKSGEGTKIIRYRAKVEDSAGAAVVLGVSLSDFLAECEKSYFLAVEKSKRSGLDADKIRANVERLRGDLAKVSEKLEKAVKEKRSAAVKKLTAEVVLLERHINDGVRTLQKGGFSVEGLTGDVNEEKPE